MRAKQRCTFVEQVSANPRELKQERGNVPSGSPNSLAAAAELAGGRFRGSSPSGGGELDAPEARRRREELNADALALFGDFAQVHDATLLLFLADRIRQDNRGAHFERRVQVQQGTMGVDDDGLAGFPELTSLAVLARSPHADANEDAVASTCAAGLSAGHNHRMV